MEFIDPRLTEYCENHTSKESDLLKKINRDTNAEVLMPRMISGHIQGAFLSFISNMIKPERILEIGTFTGYSAICLATGLTENGKIITMDINAELEERVQLYFNASENGEKIDYRIGNAMEMIAKLEDVFDLVFIDADKENYCNYYHLIFEKVKKGGFILADNVLWSGKVIAEGSKTDKDTRAILEFNSMVHEDKRVKNIILPLRDGILMVQKI